jgi:hypothetical protein
VRKALESAEGLRRVQTSLECGRPQKSANKVEKVRKGLEQVQTVLEKCGKVQQGAERLIKVRKGSTKCGRPPENVERL